MASIRQIADIIQGSLKNSGQPVTATAAKKAASAALRVIAKGVSRGRV